MTATTQQPNSQQQEPLDQLTKRERQIAVLVALAQTDQQIANSLFITVRTVKGHIDSIRGKLGVKNRTAVCRWVLVAHYERKTVLFDNVL